MPLLRFKFFIVSALLALPLGVSADSLAQLKTEVAEHSYQQAVTTGQTILKQSPRNTQALFLTALAYQKSNKLDQAAELYHTLIRLDPKQPEPRNNLAIIYLKQGRHDQAIDQLIDSLNTHPAYSTAWQNLSNLYKGLASEAYRRALSEEDNAQPVVNEIQLVTLEQFEGSSSAPIITTAKLEPAKVDKIPEIKKPPEAPAKPEVITPAPTILDVDFEKVIRDWAKHWSSKDFDRYVAAYSNSYKGNKASHNAWIEHRRSRVLKPGPVKIGIDAIQVRQSSAKSAIVDFNQSYRSSNYQDSVRKRVNLINTEYGWKITRERTLAVL
jgi:Tfp pilus assembly protein PilF